VIKLSIIDLKKMTAERSQKRTDAAFLILAGLILLNPLVVAPSVIFSFILPKAVYFRSLIEVAVFFLAILFLMGKLRFSKYKLTPIFWAVVAYISVYCLAGLAGANFFKSFWGSMERSEGILTSIHFFGFFVFLLVAAKKRIHWERLFQIFFGVGIAVSVFAIGQSIGRLPLWGGSYDRVSATFGNPAFLASYSMFGIFLAAYYFLEHKEKKKQLLAVLAFMFMTAALILSGTRAAFLGTSIGVLVIFLNALFTLENKKRKIQISIFALLVMVTFLGVVLVKDSHFRDSSILQRFTTINLEDANLRARLVGWQAAWSGFKERWFLGWGPENFDWVFNTHLSTDFFKYSSGIFDRPHNKALEVLDDGGIVLFGAFLSLYAAAIWCARKVFGRSLKFSIILAFLTGYFIQNLFVFDTISTYIAFYFFLAWLSFEYSQKIKKDGEEEPEAARSKPKNKLAFVGAFLMSFLLVFAVYFFNARFIYAGYWATSAHQEMVNQDRGWRGDLSRMDLSVFQENAARALSGSGPYIEEMRIRVFEYFFNFFYGKNIANISRTNMAVLMNVAEESEKNVTEPRSRIYMQTSYYSAGGFYYEIAKVKPELINKAITLMREGHEAFPGRIEFLRELGKMYLFKSQYDTNEQERSNDAKEAVSYFEKAVTYEYDDPYSWWSLGVAMIESGNVDGGFSAVKVAFSRGYEPSTNDLDFLIKLAVGRKNYPVLVDLYKQAMLKDPEDEQLYLSMAAAYINMGNKAKAKDLLLKLVEIKPGEKKNVDEFIKNMGL
jgi:O-antigen ligase